MLTIIFSEEARAVVVLRTAESVSMPLQRFHGSAAIRHMSMISLPLVVEPARDVQPGPIYSRESR